MENAKVELAPPRVHPKMVDSKWYFIGFTDGYRARRAVVLPWSAAWSGRAQYKKGYAEGLAAARRDFAEAIRD